MKWVPMQITNKAVTRRRALRIAAAAAGLGAVGIASARRRAHDLHRWSGVALGAPAEIVLRHRDAAAAARIFGLVEAELDRLQSIFSLYRPQSALSRLNRMGVLAGPPLELVEVLSLCDSVHRATLGAFDPAVQALWAYHAEVAAGASPPDSARFAAIRAGAGWRHVSVSSERISFASSDAALTLNGVAQGYITDRIAALMRANGMINVLVGLGEIAALGARAEFSSWRVGIAGADEHPAESIDLVNAAIATSAPLATTFDAAGAEGHILDPRSGRPVKSDWRQISVIHRSAAIADALSTGMVALDRTTLTLALGHFQPAQIIAFDRDGRRAAFRTPQE